MLEYGISDFHKPAAKRAIREQLIGELSENVEQSQYHMALLGNLEPESLLKDDAQSDFEMKAILVKEVGFFRKRIVELYLLFPDKEYGRYLGLLNDLREAERALVLLEKKRVTSQKLKRFDSKAKKERLETVAKLDALLEKIEGDLEEIRSELNKSVRQD